MSRPIRNIGEFFSRWSSERFVHVLILQVIVFAVWELYAREVFLASLMSNPDVMDRAFYAKVADGMRSAILFVLVLSGVAFGVWEHAWLDSVSRSAYLSPIILALSAFLQLSIIFLLATPPFSDSQFYVDHARRLAETGSYIGPGGHATAFWPVGYPAILAIMQWLTGDMLVAGRILNIAVNLLLIVVVHRIFAPRLSTRASALFLLLFALHPLTLFSSVVLMTEPLFTLLLWSGTWLLLCPAFTLRHAAVIGLLAAVAAYIRPAALLYFAVMILYHIWTTKHYRQALLAVAVCAALLAPWSIRNAQVFGRFVPISTNGGFNFLMGNHRAATGGVNFDFVYNPENLGEADASADAVLQGLQGIAQDPLAALARLPRKLLHAYSRSDAPVIWALKPLPEPLPGTMAALILYLSNGMGYLMLPFLVVGMLRHRARDGSHTVPPLVLLLYGVTLVIVLLFFGTDRFILPMLPVHVYFMARALTRFHRGQWKAV